jgi:dynein heavy chain
MKDGLRKLFYQYYSQHMQGTKKQLEREKLMAVIKKFPGQVLLTCASMSWTTDVLFALTQLEQLGQPNALRKCKQNYKKKVESYIELVEKPGISKVDRLKLVALIIIDEHNREIIERIYSQKITSPRHFAWLQ